MTRRVSRLTVGGLAVLPDHCQDCTYWQFDPVRRAQEQGRERMAKATWLAEVATEWGQCGSLLRIDDAYVGHIMWAPAMYLPGADGFATSPVSSDAVVMAAIHIDPSYRHQGLGRVLVQSMVSEVAQRGDTRAIEAFGAVQPVPGECVVPMEFLAVTGFEVVRDHGRYPRMRLDLRSVASWRSDVESAFERFLRPARLGSPSPAVRDAEPWSVAAER